MPKTICLFSDGTGQAGGANPIDWTSVYRLFVNVRDRPGQLCFYDPGLGSDPDAAEDPNILAGVRQWISQAIGSGITRNIVDCYAALLVTYEPGDRVFLFGFSRGGYTIRSLGGAMALCGVPPGLPKAARWQDVRTALNDPRVRTIAEEAVREVYQTYDDKALRLSKAEAFRRKHGSQPLPPFFIGVWDTVRALGWQVFDVADFGRHRFHDSKLNPAVRYGRQALSIDENRKVFAPELWDERDAPEGQIEQLWFAGVHADIGGGYGLRRGLTDLAMRWMVDEAMAARDPSDPTFAGLSVEPNLLAELNLDPLGPQEDERARGWLGWAWVPGTREAYTVRVPELQGDARTQPTLGAASRRRRCRPMAGGGPIGPRRSRRIRITIGSTRRRQRLRRATERLRPHMPTARKRLTLRAAGTRPG